MNVFGASGLNSMALDALVHPGHRLDDSIHPVIDPSTLGASFPKPFLPAPKRLVAKEGVGCQWYCIDDDQPDEEDEQQESERQVTVRGADIRDLPTTYQVEGLQGDEFPVIGTYVDLRIVPGFRYRVRKLGSKRFLFNGRGLTLRSIGRGYAKRITFEGDTFNYNDNYFYSDTNPQGFGFSLAVAEPHDWFAVTTGDDNHPVAEARLHEVLHQRELSSGLARDGSFVKEVSVTFTCRVEYASQPGGLMSLYSREELRKTGVAIIIRGKGERKAHTKFIKQLDLQHHGSVTFQA